MPAVKHKKKPKSHKVSIVSRTILGKRPAKTSTRHANAFCKGECRLRTKGMRVGETRRRVHGKRRYKVIRMPDAE